MSSVPISQPLGEQTISPDRLDWIAGLLAVHPFRFAKTMPDNPHWYTLRMEWEHTPGLFTEVIQTILDTGYDERWGKNIYRMLNVNGWKYWSMVYQTKWTAADAIVLNRKPIQEEDRIVSYDGIADVYDGAFEDPESVAENHAVMELIGDISGCSVLDIGCGTGLLLDYKAQEVSEYLGIDPSPRMLERLIDKHPWYANNVLCARMEEFAPVLLDGSRDSFDVITCLFGSAGHIGKEWIERIPGMLAPGGTYIVMFSEDTYVPVTWERLGHEVMPFTPGKHASLPGTETKIGHYIAVVGP